MTEPAWRILWKAELLLVISIFVAVILVVGGQMYSLDVAKQVKEMEKKINFLKNKKRLQLENIRLMGEFKPTYEKFSAKGVFNQEPRMQWLENVLAIGDELKFTEPIKYSLKIRSDYNPPFPVRTGSFKLYYSRMELDMNLLHEGDLLNFFRLLEARAPGIFDVKNCLLERIANSNLIEGNKLATTLSAKCDLDWYTMWDIKGGRG